MRLQAKMIGGCVGAFVLLAGPAAQASSWSGAAASAASNAGNAAVQSAVQSARDEVARRAMAQQQWNYDLKRASRHHGSR